MIYKVEKFLYNGFMVSYPRGAKAGDETKYTAEFIEWTNDPGICECKCSDGKNRLIPSCCLIGDKSELPQQSMKNKQYFGKPSYS